MSAIYIQDFQHLLLNIFFDFSQIFCRNWYRIGFHALLLHMCFMPSTQIIASMTMPSVTSILTGSCSTWRKLCPSLLTVQKGMEY
jgi:hypothetical protein